MRRLWALVVVIIVVAVAIPAYWVLATPASPSPCSTGPGPPPLVKPLGTAPLNLWYNSSALVGTVDWFNFTLLSSFHFPFGSLTLEIVISGYWTPVGGASGYLVWNTSHTLVARAVGSNATWVEGASTEFNWTATITVVALTTFPYNESLLARIPGPCGTTPTAISTFGDG